jgi:hypothetical protein
MDGRGCVWFKINHNGKYFILDSAEFSSYMKTKEPPPNRHGGSESEYQATLQAILGLLSLGVDLGADPRYVL